MSQYIDETAFVEAASGRTNLIFEDDKQQARFELGVSMMVYKWDALDTAVENKWGGPDSAEKRDWITSILVDLFRNEKVVDAILIEETLLYAMIDEFETNVEDDSALPIASEIINIYKQCDMHDYSKVEGLYIEWQNRQKNKISRKVQLHNDPLNADISSSSSDDDEEMIYEGEDNRSVEIDESSTLENMVDDDGFELVQKKGKRRH